MAGEKGRSDTRSINWKLIGMMVLVLLALQWLWPNLVHEPLHLLALQAQGAEGTIDFDFSFPAHPSVTRTTELNGLAGALAFYFLPSLVSVAILFGLWLTRKRGTVWSHFVLPAYLGFDMVINLRGYADPTSDFRIFSLFPQTIPIVLMVAVGILTVIVLVSARCEVQKYCLLEVFDG